MSQPRVGKEVPHALLVTFGDRPSEAESQATPLPSATDCQWPLGFQILQNELRNCGMLGERQLSIAPHLAVSDTDHEIAARPQQHRRNHSKDAEGEQAHPHAEQFYRRESRDFHAAGETKEARGVTRLWPRPELPDNLE
jgi:hypothetical protein